MFRIKICGVTRLEDARAVASSDADALGLNFYPPSPRSLSADKAELIANAVRGQVKLVGVYVNESVERLIADAEQLGLDAVQLHGDEPAELLADLPERLPIVRALRVGEEGLVVAERLLEACQKAGRLPDALLVDAAAGSAYGGTGKQVDWQQVAAERDRLGEVPLILAGGLRPDNVAQAIQVVRPDGVDTASGVESSPGVKDALSVQSFASTASKALATKN